MTSPFHEEQGVKHNHGDIEFEWRSLLDTPCYGFSGPNSCYSSTCNHNPSPSKTEKRLNKLKLSNSLKLSFKYHPKKSPNCERVSDYKIYKPILHRQSDAYVYSNNPYADYEYNGSNDFIDSDSSEKQQMYDDLPLSEETKDNQIYETSDYQSVETCSDSPSDENDQPNMEHSMSSSNEIDALEKKYEFNPLSEPFHPTRSIYSNSSSPTNFTASSPECASSISSADDLDNSTTLFMDKNYVCILCPERFSTSEELEKHIVNKVQKPHNCFVCGLSYSQNYLLYRHMRNHRKLKTFKCRGCSKKFRNLNQLGKHFEFCRFKLYMFI